MHKGMGITKSIIEHPEWGTIIVARNARARRIILRSRPDGIHITTPPLATKKDIERAIDECVPRLMQRQEQRQKSIIDRQYRIDGENFVFRIEEHAAQIFQIRYSGKEAVLLCPIGTCYSDMKMQEWLRKAMTTALARRAKELLPDVIVMDLMMPQLNGADATARYQYNLSHSEEQEVFFRLLEF